MESTTTTCPDDNNEDATILTYGQDDGESKRVIKDKHSIGGCHKQDDENDVAEEEVMVEPKDTFMEEEEGRVAVVTVQPFSSSNQEEDKIDLTKTSGTPHTADIAEKDETDSRVAVTTKTPPRRTTQTLPSGWRQVRALMYKNGLLKLRTPVATFFELFSPLLMMLILAAAYTLSETVEQDARIYATISLELPGPWLDLAVPALGVITQRMGIDSDAVVMPGGNERRRRRLWETTGNKTNTEELARLLPSGHQLIDHIQSLFLDRRILQEQDDDGHTPPSPDSDSNNSTGNDFTTDLDLLDQVRRQLVGLLESPMIVPSFDTYVGISTAISQVVDVNSIPSFVSSSSFGRRFGNLLTLGTIHLSPNSGHVRGFKKYLEESYPLVFDLDLVKMRIHKSESDALTYINANLDERTWALIHFGDTLDQVSLRFNSTVVPNTNQIVDYNSIGLNTAYQQYFLSGFLTLQRTVTEYHFNVTGCGEDLSNIWTMPFPTPAYSQNTFFLVVGFLLGLSFVMAFLYPTSRLVKSLVEEKETRMREYLYIMGVRGWSHWMSWYLTSVLVFVLVITPTVTAALCMTILRFSSWYYIFLYIGLFSTASIGVCFTVAATFISAKKAAVAGPIVLFATLLPRYLFFEFNRYEASTWMTVASLFPATCFSFGADIIAATEYGGVGIQRWNTSEGLYSFNTCLVMLFVDSIFYLVLSIYLDRVIGIGCQPLCLSRPRLWAEQLGLISPKHDISPTLRTSKEFENPNFEKSDGRGVFVSVSNLVKRYDTNSTPAIDDLSFELRSGEITVLLGHNGSGKSTTIGCMTGLIKPTDGDCFVGDHSIVKNTRIARQSIGFVPQENLIFGPLTVKEHLRLASQLKGVRWVENDIQRHAAEIGLIDFLDTKAANLSGGNKRKLQVAIALCGDPAVLILDEATSGVDSNSRRDLWELLRKRTKRERGETCTLLCSHHMSDAEVLGDKILILQNGKLRCAGSAAFLKDRFGMGWDVTVVCEDLSHFETVKSLVPHLKLRVSSKEISFRIPRGLESELPVLLDRLDESGLMYGIADSSLEEIFLLLADKDGGDSDSTGSRDESRLSLSSAAGNLERGIGVEEITASLNVEGSSVVEWEKAMQRVSPTTLQQVQVLCWKRVVLQRRDVKSFCFAIVAPVAVIALCLGVLMISPLFASNPIALSPSLYNEVLGRRSDTEVVVSSPSNVSSVNLKDFLQTFPINEQSDFIRVQTIESMSSLELSRFLLIPHDNNTLAPRFGAFVIDDAVDVSLVLEENTGTELKRLFQPLDFLIQFENKNNSAYASSIDVLLSKPCNSDVMPDLDVFLPTFAQALNEIIDDLQERTDPLLADNVTDSSGFFLDWLSDPSSFEQTSEIVRYICDNLQPFQIFSSQVLDQSSQKLPVTMFNTQLNSRVNILHNTSSPHALAAFYSSYIDSLYSTCGASNEVPKRFIIWNSVLPLTTQQSIEVQTVLSVLASIMILIPFGFIPAALSVVNIVVEKNRKSKLLQLVSGAGLLPYWISHYLCDLVLFGIVTLLVMMVFLAFGTESAIVFVGDADSFGATSALILGFSVSVIPLTFLIARSGKSGPGAQQVNVASLLFLFGFVAVNAYFMMSQLDSTKDVAANLLPFFRLSPPFLLGEGFVNLASAFWEREILGSKNKPLDWDVTGKQIAILFLLAPFYFTILMFLEFAGEGGSGGILGRWIRNVRRHAEDAKLNRLVTSHGRTRSEGSLHKKTEDSADDNVLREAELAEKLSSQENAAPLVIRHLWKVYAPTISCRMSQRPRLAVRGINLIVPHGEVLALLGSNGCGKSTTIGMITGDVPATSGEVIVAGHDMTGVTPSGVTNGRKYIGLCPQVDPLLDCMTGRETLKLFARLRGISKASVDLFAEEMIRRLTLEVHADKITSSYSGGNKRKLSLGIALLVGEDGVQLLDEISSGLDILAQRRLWNLIKELGVKRPTVIISHAFSEVEALCSRIAIMAHGQLLALGTVQELKAKYHDGYSIRINVSVEARQYEIDSIVSEIVDRTLPGSKLVEEHGRFLTFDVPKVTNIGLGTCFRKLQALKNDENGLVETFTLSQSSLEQVFLSLTRDANGREGPMTDQEEVAVGDDTMMEQP